MECYQDQMISLRIENNTFNNVRLELNRRFSNFISNRTFHFIGNIIKNSAFDLKTTFENFFVENNSIYNSYFEILLVGCSLNFYGNRFLTKYEYFRKLITSIHFQQFQKCQNIPNNLIFMYNIFENTQPRIKIENDNSSIYLKKNQFKNSTIYNTLILLKKAEILKNYPLKSRIEIHENLINNCFCDTFFEIKVNEGDHVTLTIMNNTITNNKLRNNAIVIDGYVKPKIHFNVLDNKIYGEETSNNYEIFFRPLLSLFWTETKFDPLDVSFNYFNSDNPYERIYDGHKDGMSPKAELSFVFIDKNLSKLRNVSVENVNFSNFQGRFDKNMELYGNINVTGRVLINGNVLINDSNCNIYIDPMGEIIINGNLEILRGKHQIISAQKRKKVASGGIKVLNGFVKIKNVEIRESFMAFYWNSKIEIESFHCNYLDICFFFYQINEKIVKINKGMFGSSSRDGLSALEFFQSYNISINNSQMKSDFSSIRITNTINFPYSLINFFPLFENSVKLIHLKENVDLSLTFWTKPTYSFQLRAPKDYMIVIYFKYTLTEDTIFDEVAQKFIYFKVCSMNTFFVFFCAF